MQKPAISTLEMGNCQVLTRNSSGVEIAKSDLMIYAGYGGLATFEESVREICSECDPLGRSS